MANDQELIKEVYPISILRASQQNKDEDEHWISEDVTKKWTDNPQGVSPEYPYEFCCTRYYTYKNKSNPSEGKGWQPWDIKNISLWAHYGMNATPYQLLLGNPYESIYQIEASGATREAYVIIDGDGISTGEIILQGGYENKDQKFNLKIDELSILDPISNIEHHFEETNNYLTINLGDNWKCRFERSNNNGNPVIKIIGIGPNPESSVTPPSTIELAPTDSCFKCDLGGKYQKKIIIQAKNNQKHITATATWTVTAIRDKNGDGIWRYKIMPNIDRVVKMSYFKKISDSQSNHIRSVYNIGDADSVTFDIEKDTYGQAWRNITNQACRVVIKNIQGGNAITVPANGGPITVPFAQLRSELDAISDAHPTSTQTLQYTVELQVVDPDYEANSEGYSVVDKCNLLFEYIVCEAGEDGKDGSSSVFNLSNDSGSFAYKYNDGTIKLSDNDKTTNIQYIVESNYKCCDSIKVGENTHNDSESGTCGRVNYQITKNTKDWTLEVTSIIPGDYSSVFAIPITGIVAGKEVGTATFKMTGVKDLNEDGVYSYRLVPEHAYSQENPGPDTLDVTVFRDVLIEGKGYSKGVNVIVQVISKLDKSILSTSEATKVSCSLPAEIDTQVSMSTIQSHKGVVVKVYTNDEDYNNRPALSENSPYHFTGEAEDIPWTAPQGPQGGTGEVDYEELKKSIKTISCNNDSIVVTGGSTYTFRFTDIGGKGKDVTLSLNSDAWKFFKDTKNLTGNTITLEAKSYEELSKLDPFSGEITYTDSTDSNISGTIRYTWVGDANSDGVYYDYEIEPSAQVLGYTEVDRNLAFNIGEITITCKNVRHEGVLKTQTKGSGYILVGSNKVEGNNFGQLDENGQVTITLGEPPKESTEESKKLYYSKKTSFRVYWFTYDKDYEEAHKKDPKSIPIITINETTYYQVDSELIDVVPNTAIDATTNLQAYTGSGTFIVDPKTLKATFEYKSDAPGYYLVRFNKAQSEGTGDIYFANTTVTPTQPNTVEVIMGPELMRTTTTSTENQLTLDNINGPYGPENYKELVKTSKVAWIKCPSVHVGIYKENTFNTLLFEDTVVRTGLDGYYWNVDENGVVSVQSNGDVMTSINQTANSIVSIASGVSPNLCEGAATNKTSLFYWVKGDTGNLVNSFNNSKEITSPSTDCQPIGTGLSVTTKDAQCTYYNQNFKLNEGYYGISLSPNPVTEGGTITVGYDGSLLSDPSNPPDTPSGSAIVISKDYKGKGIKFTVPETLLGKDCILSFYASQNGGNVCVKANTTTPSTTIPYKFKTTSNMERYVLKLNNLQSRNVIIYKDDTDSTLYISSIQFEKGSLVTDWKDYGQDVSTIIQDASSIRAEVTSIKEDQKELRSSITETASEIKTEVATIKNGQEELNSSITQTADNIRTEVETKLQGYATTSYVNQYAKGIDMATVVNGIRTAGINIKNGDTEVTNGEITEGQGSVELTGQVIATNFMVKSGDQGIDAIMDDSKGIVMCITTWGNAKNLGSNAAITLDDNVPVFVIKSKNQFFILNPLALTSPGTYPASYEAIPTFLYRSKTSISLNDIISNKTPKNIYKYSAPSYKLEGNKKIDIIERATDQIGVMCKDKNYENLTASPPTFNTDSLLNDFTIKRYKTIKAPVYVNSGSNPFITFVPMDIFKVIKYTDGGINKGDEHTIFIGEGVNYYNGKVSLSGNKGVLYKLREIPVNNTIEKEFTNTYNDSIKVNLAGIALRATGIYDVPIFITKIGDTEFKYILEAKDTIGKTIENFIKDYSSEKLTEFTVDEADVFSRNYIDVEYKEFLDFDSISGICNIYGITSSVL